MPHTDIRQATQRPLAVNLDPRSVGGLAAVLILAAPGVSLASVAPQSQRFDLPAQPLRLAIAAFARRTGTPIAAAEAHVAGRRAQPVRGRMTPSAALERMLTGTGLEARPGDGGAWVLVPARPARAEPAPPSGPSRHDSVNVAVQVEDVVVSGYRDIQMAGVTARRREVRLTEVRTSDSIGQQPDYNIADSLRRLPGVQTVFDEDEGRYVSIRGLNASYTLGGLDGAALATAERNNRQLNMESIPSTAVKALEVIKSPTPDLDGNAIGGLINLKARSPLGEPGRHAVFSAFVGASDSTGAPGRGYGRPFDDGDNFRLDGAVSATFGDHDRLGLLISGHYSRRSRDQERFSVHNPVTAAGPAPAPAGSTLLYQAYPNTVDRYGALIKAEARVTPGLTATFSLSHFQQDDNELRLGHRLIGQGVSLVQFNSFQIEKPLTTAQAAAEWTPRPGHRMRMRGSRSRAVFYEPSPEVVFSLPSPTAGFEIGLQDGVSRLVRPDPRLLDSSQYVFARHSPYVDDSRETVDELQVDYAIGREHMGPWGFQFGAKRRVLNRESDRTQVFHVAQGSRVLRLSDVLTREVYRPLHGAHTQPIIDYNAFLHVFQASPTDFRLDETRTLINSIGSDYTVRETVDAAYVLAEHRGPRHVLIVGARGERTGTQARFVRRTGPGAVTADFTPIQTRAVYDDILPSATFVLDLSSALKLRLAYAEGVGRPNPGDLAAPESVADDGGLVRGNPDLRARRGRTYDVTLERYFDQGQGLLAASLFRKAVAGEIYRYLDREQIDGAAAWVSRPRNVADATIDGVEFSLVRRSLPMIPAVGVSANLSWLNGRGILLTATGNRRRLDYLPQQSEWLANLAVFYESGPFEAHLSYAFVSEATVQVGETSAADQVQAASHQLDVQLRLNLTNRMRLTAEVRNLTDEDKRTLTGARRDILRDHSIYGRQFWVGAAIRY